MSYKPEVKVGAEWSRNGLVFATEGEALANARNLQGRWTLVDDVRAVESELPVNARWVDGRLEMLADGAAS